MLNFLKKENKFQLFAPISGKVCPISEAADPVFAEKIVGDGVFINAEDTQIVAPCAGEISFIADTKHAFAMTLDNGVEVLVHIGLETVALRGEGFTQLVPQGTRVKAGTPIIAIDRDFILSRGVSLSSPILITNPEVTKSLIVETGVRAIAGKTVILEYTL